MKEYKNIIILIIVIVVVLLIAFIAMKITDKMFASGENKLNNNIKKIEKAKSNNDIDYVAKAKEMQALPKQGEEIAIMNIKSYGTIKIKFFKDVAPKAVENFVTHSKNGYYNGLTFHRVINDFMIQGGDPNGNGTGGQSIWGENFAKEVNDEYFPFRGTLCMASGRAEKSLGSQFFITQAKFNEKFLNNTNNVNKSLIEAYKEFGGYPSLFKNYTVFGFVYEGMDIVDKIAAIQTDQNNKPVSDVIIENIQIMENK